MIDGAWTGSLIYWTLKQLVTTNNYDSLTQLHSPKITVTTAHIKVFSDFPSRCSVAASNGDVPLPLGSRNVTGLSYQLLISHNCNSQPTQTTTQSQNHVTTDGQSALGSSTHLGPKTRFILLSDSCEVFDMGRSPSLTRRRAFCRNVGVFGVKIILLNHIP
jgi:hypothetical protein